MSRKLTQKDRDTLWDALDSKRRFDASIFPRGAGQWSHFRKLERLGLLQRDGYGEDIDGEIEEEVMGFALTDEGRIIALEEDSQ